MKLKALSSFTQAHTASDYKDDGTNILLDANENAYGPSLALNGEGKLPGANANGRSDSVDLDLLGLNRYPDPYAHLPLHHKRQLTLYTATKQNLSSSCATFATPTLTRPRVLAPSTCL